MGPAVAVLVLFVVFVVFPTLAYLHHRGQLDRKRHQRVVEELVAARTAIADIEGEIRTQTLAAGTPDLWPLTTILNGYHTALNDLTKKEIA